MSKQPTTPSTFSPYQPPRDDQVSSYQSATAPYPAKTPTLTQNPQPSPTITGNASTSRPSNYTASANPYADSYQAGGGVGAGTARYNSGEARGLSSVSGGGDQLRVNKYDTTLPVRVDVLAAAAYMLGPITGALLLIFETTNDYVRFHAWQSCLFFSGVMALHLFFLMFSSFLGWLFFVGELGSVLFLGFKAYQDGQTLDRFHLPIVGDYAARWVDAE